MTKLADLKLKPYLLLELHQLGYVDVRDMEHLSNVDCLRIPYMGGRDWRKIAGAMGREPFSSKSGA
ncbi:hypothetical protein LVY75_00330 (plasmid) [Sinorhizobium sp. B11]